MSCDYCYCLWLIFHIKQLFYLLLIFDGLVCSLVDIKQLHRLHRWTCPSKTKQIQNFDSENAQGESRNRKQKDLPFMDQITVIWIEHMKTLWLINTPQITVHKINQLITTNIHTNQLFNQMTSIHFPSCPKALQWVESLSPNCSCCGLAKLSLLLFV